MWISRKRSLAWAGVARTSRLLPQSQVVGSHCLDENLPIDRKDSGVWRTVACREGQVSGCPG